MPLFEDRKVVLRLGQLRIQRQRSLQVYARVRALVLQEAHGSEPGLCLGEVGLQVDTLPQLHLGGRPIFFANGATSEAVVADGRSWVLFDAIGPQRLRIMPIG